MKGSSRARLVLILLIAACGVLLFVYSQNRSGGIFLQAGAAAQILIDPSNPAATEVTVNEGNTLQIKPRVLDSAGNVIDNALLAYSSLSTDIATVDAAGNIQAKKAGFSTLIVSSGSVVASATITVVTVTSGAAGFDVTGVAQDLSGRLYLADTRDHTILLADNLQGAPAVYAGVNQTPGLANDERLKSLFNSPTFLAFNEADGSLYISDAGNNVIRKARPGPAGRVETPALTQPLNNPQGLALDNRGFLWVADSGSHTIKRINLINGSVSTIAGQSGSPGLADGTGSQARFNTPFGLAIETESLARQLQRQATGAPPPPVSVIIADSGNGLVRRVKETGEVETIGQTSTKAKTSLYQSTPPSPLSMSPAPLPSTALVTFNAPTGVAVDPLGNIYVSETGNRQVKTILLNGTIVAAAQANTFAAPRGIAITSSGRVIVADSNRLARQISYSPPLITGTTPDRIGNQGGITVRIKGQNFSPESSLVIAGAAISGVQVVDTQTVTFTTPVLPSGRTTVTVQNRGGLAQASLLVDPVPLSQLQTGQITTVAGGSTYSGDGGPALSAGLNIPTLISFDVTGNLYIADTFNNRIRKVDVRTGIITTAAGNGQRDYYGDNGPATAAALQYPEGMALDSSGNLYISDTVNNVIRKVDARTGVITGVAGTGQPGFFGENIPAYQAAVYTPEGLAIDSSGSLYFADGRNNRIRRIDGRTGIITTIAGNGQSGYAGDNGQATMASLKFPVAVAFDSAANLYIADWMNHVVRRIDLQTGIITTVAGNGLEGTPEDNQPATQVALGLPFGIAVDSSRNLYIADQENLRVFKVDLQTGIITAVAGNGQRGFAGDNGPATSAAMNVPEGLAIDSSGNIYFADTRNHRIRRVDARTRLITTVAGSGQSSFVGDNEAATAAALKLPVGLTVDALGNIYIADTFNNRIRKVDSRTGVITTLAGSGEAGLSGDNVPAVTVPLAYPEAPAVDRFGNVFFADTLSHRIRRVDALTGFIATVAGNGQQGFSSDEDVPATQTPLNGPEGLAFNSLGNLFIADTVNHRVRVVNAQSGHIFTVAGNGQQGFSGDGVLAFQTKLNTPGGLAFDLDGNLYIADALNHRIRKVDARTLIISTVAGTGQQGFAGDNGPAVAAALNVPIGLAIDALGDIFIGDTFNQRIRKVDRAGIITTIGGSGVRGFYGDSGPAAAAIFDFPKGLAIDAAGNLLLADFGNGRVRAIRGPINRVLPPSRRRP